MKVFFLQILDMSVSASILAVAVIVLRLLLKKAPKAIHCALWAMVALRLVCPSLPESGASLMPDSHPVSSVVEVQVEKPPVTQVQPPAQAPQAPVPDMPSPITPEPEKPVDWMNVLSILWLSGVAVMTLYGFGSYLFLRRKVAPAVKEEGVWLCDNVPSPFILGIFRPRIYLPSALEPEHRASVLAHERSHLRRKDHWWKPLGFALLAVHWFNPVMWLAYVLLCRDIEAACDERVVKKLEPQERKAYSEALLSCAAPRRSIAACPLAFGEQGVKGRIKSVLSYKKPTVWIILAALVASVSLGVFFLTDPIQRQQTDQSELTYGVKAPANPHKYNSTNLEVLKTMVPSYFEASDFKGMEVYVWDDEGMLWCGILPGTNAHKTQSDIDEMDAVPLSAMALILGTYEDTSEISVFVLGESRYWEGTSRVVQEGNLELWLKGELGLLDIDIVQDISTNTTTMKIRVGTKVHTYREVDGKVWEYHLGELITDQAWYDRGFDPSGLPRYNKTSVYTVRNEGMEKLIANWDFFELISTEYEVPVTNVPVRPEKNQYVGMIYFIQENTGLYWGAPNLEGAKYYAVPVTAEERDALLKLEEGRVWHDTRVSSYLPASRMSLNVVVDDSWNFFSVNDDRYIMREHYYAVLTQEEQDFIKSLKNRAYETAEAQDYFTDDYLVYQQKTKQ